MQLEYDYKSFMVDLLNTQPAEKKKLVNKASFSKNDEEPEEEVPKQKKFTTNDEPRKIMGNVTVAKLNSIVESVREQNLFYIQSINETEENIEK